MEVVTTLSNLQSGTVILKLKGMFAKYVIPLKLVTYNGNQFSSAEIKLFVDKWETEHVTSYSVIYARMG